MKIVFSNKFTSNEYNKLQKCLKEEIEILSKVCFKIYINLYIKIYFNYYIFLLFYNIKIGFCKFC